MRKGTITAILIFGTLLLTSFFHGIAEAAGGKLYVVTSSTTLQDLCVRIGGSRVEVESLARGTQDLHYVEPRPSFVSKIRHADLVVVNGFAFDTPWVGPLLEASRNADVMPGGKGYVDASSGIAALEVPQGKVSMAHGELHPLGNPHYLIDPRRAVLALKNILDGMARVAPQHADEFRANHARYVAALMTKIIEWEKRMTPFKGKPVVTYHKSWTYFLHAFGLREFGTVESKPAIPPSPSHVNQLIKEMKAHGVRAILKEPYFPNKFPELIARQVGGTLVVLPEWVGGAPGTESYIALMDHLVEKVVAALSGGER